LRASGFLRMWVWLVYGLAVWSLLRGRVVGAALLFGGGAMLYCQLLELRLDERDEEVEHGA